MAIVVDAFLLPNFFMLIFGRTYSAYVHFAYSRIFIIGQKFNGQSAIAVAFPNCILEK